MACEDPIEQLVTAFNAHDARAFASAFAPEGLMFDYPDRIAGQGQDQIEAYMAGMFAAFPKVRVELIGRIDLGARQITHERFDRGDGSAHYEAAMIYNMASDGIDRLDFVRALRAG